MRVRLPDGRLLSCAEFGDPAGLPALYFHGFPGSRLEARLIEPLASERGVRLFAIDRPGFGASEFQPGREILDWPADVEALVDRLGIERFSVIGVSGGGPYALACALRLGDRLRSVGVASAMGPVDDPAALRGMFWPNRAGLTLGRRAPWVAPLLFAPLSVVFRRAPRLITAHLAMRVSAADQAIFGNPRFMAIFSESLREAFRASWRGPALDALLYCRPWGFDLREISMPVHLWHGERDTIVPAALGRRMAAELSDCRAVFHPDDGHFSAAIGRAPEILDRLAGRGANCDDDLTGHR